MYKTQKNRLRTNKKTYKVLKELVRDSKNLYNYTLYVIRQYYFFNGKYLPYKKAYHLVKNSDAYKSLPSQVAQQTMKIVDRNFKSFFRLLKERKKGNYNRPIHIPKYMDKNGFFVCIFPSQMFKIEGNKIRLSLGRSFQKKYSIKYLYFKLPPHLTDKQIKEVRILPRCKATWFEIEYVYKTETEKLDLDTNKALAIDLGLDNFATCIDTNGTAFIIEGRYIKSFNRWYNKRKAKLQSVYSKQKIKGGKESCKLNMKRKFIINNFMNQAVAYIVKHCIKNNIGKIIIGELKDIKQNINLGKINNQNFVSIPYGLFKQKLKAKCEYYGIDYIEVNEAYTSQTCCNCKIVRKSNRVHRGLYVCKNCGMVLNADVNGAINILRKVAGDSVVKQIFSSGLMSRPVRIRVIPVKGNYQTSHEAPFYRWSSSCRILTGL